MSQVAFSWNGLPQYAARLIAAAIRTHGSACTVVGSRPTVPVRGVEQALGQPVHWVDAGQPTSWKGLGLQVPRVFFQSGWAYPAFNALGDEVRAAGGQVCLLMDNNWRGDFRQWIGAAWYRLCQRRKFAAILVPGKSGRRLARWYGMPDDCIWEGMYGADPAIFFNGPPLAERPKRIIFVGQYIDRKQCLTLAQAFAAVADRMPGWELDMYGSGPQQELIPSHPRLRVNGFVQPEQLGALYRFRAASFFCLMPSALGRILLVLLTPYCSPLETWTLCKQAYSVLPSWMMVSCNGPSLNLSVSHNHKDLRCSLRGWRKLPDT